MRVYMSDIPRFKIFGFHGLLGKTTKENFAANWFSKIGVWLMRFDQELKSNSSIFIFYLNEFPF